MLDLQRIEEMQEKIIFLKVPPLMMFSNASENDAKILGAGNLTCVRCSVDMEYVTLKLKTQWNDRSTTLI